ncbi:MAG: DUF1573 domain-containing protein [Chitinophagaceae bacterium]|nr:DUF1573 domain-containing protein [Chitinophagaceae bacterium]
MRRVALIFSFFFIACTADAQQRVANPNATLVHQDSLQPATILFKENEFNFGQIPQGRPVTHVFSFVNSGKTPVVLSNVKASCGCTTPVWDRDTIPQGGSSKITVGYNAAAEGEFAKSITVTYNGNQYQQLIIKGDVWKTPVTSAPENDALNQFKQK